MTAERFLCFFFATLALAQSPATKRPIHIDGKVVDRETHAAIPNAKVTLVATEDSDQQVTASDADGRFSFDTIEPTHLVLPLRFQAAAPGYLVALPNAAPGLMAMALGEGSLLITHEQSKFTTELRLTRVASLSGVLVDQDSKKPIAKLIVAAQFRMYRGGQATYRQIGVRPVTTAADGSFQFDGLSAGDYILRVQDPLLPKIEALPAGELPVQDEGALGYGNVILPGATADYPEFASIAVRSDAAVDLGDVPLRQQRLHNFVGTVDTDCRDSERVTVLLEERGSNGLLQSGGISPDIPCGPFRISNVPEGSFTVGLHLTGGREAGYASQPLDIRSGDPIHLRVQPRGVLKGIVQVEDTPADQFPKDLENLPVVFIPKTMPNFALDLATFSSVNGKFGDVMYAGETYEAMIRPPEAYYVKRLFYNDVEQPDTSRLTTTPGVVDHVVRIVLSPHPAAFQAQVDPGSTVVLLPDGVDSARRYAERVVLTPGRQQAVVKRGLRPGPYHAFVIPTASLADLELPGGIDRYLIDAQSVKLEEGETANLTDARH